jgi:uncharacterized protein DUF2188
MTKLIDVRCTQTGTWAVILAGCAEPLSTHVSETEAERAAREQAARGAATVIVHDRYERTHEVPADR